MQVEGNPFLSADMVKEELIHIYRLPAAEYSDEACIQKMNEVLKNNLCHVESDWQLQKAKAVIETWQKDPTKYSGIGEVLELIVNQIPFDKKP